MYIRLPSYSCTFSCVAQYRSDKLHKHKILLINTNCWYCRTPFAVYRLSGFRKILIEKIDIDNGGSSSNVSRPNVHNVRHEHSTVLHECGWCSVFVCVIVSSVLMKGCTCVGSHSDTHSSTRTLDHRDRVHLFHFICTSHWNRRARYIQWLPRYTLTHLSEKSKSLKLYFAFIFTIKCWHDHRHCRIAERILYTVYIYVYCLLEPTIFLRFRKSDIMT